MSDFSIRMNGDDGLAPPVDLFPLRPDPKGPKLSQSYLFSVAY